MSRWFSRFVKLTSLLAALAVCPTATHSQITGLDDLGLSGGIASPFGPPGGAGSEVAVSAQFTPSHKGGVLQVTAKIATGYHIYSITQQPGGPIRTTIKLDPSPNFQLAGAFKTLESTKPHIKKFDFWPDLDVEEHAGAATWEVPITLAAGAQAADVNITGTVVGQVCDANRCNDFSVKFTAQLAQPKQAGPIRLGANQPLIRGSIEPRQAAPGDVVQLTLTVEPAEHWHIYHYLDVEPETGISKPTLIAPTGSSIDDWGRPTTTSKVLTKKSLLANYPDDRYYEGPVAWTIPLTVPKDAPLGEHAVSGILGYQTCKEAQCLLPTAVKFSASLVVAETSAPGKIELSFEKSKYGVAAAAAKLVADRSSSANAPAVKLDLGNLNTTDSASSSIAWELFLAFLAGFILNFMPCVLPVIGLKVMAFVQQAGNDRRKIFMLNLWYSLGLMSVFMVLATLAVFVGIGWGEQFNSDSFNIVMAAIVFVFALSFLGVWEIPIPGFVGTGKANDLQQQEGAAGAFFKGILTTILATPCAGPLLVPAITWAVRQPAEMAYTAFGLVGLGMASPYLLIGAFPKLVGFLPKPGAWMETFKHIMGFVLLGTVIFVMTFLKIPYLVPTFAFMFSLWAACWWIGRISFTAERQVKIRGWMAAIAFSSLMGFFSYGWFYDVMEGRFEEQARDFTQVAKKDEKAMWQPYSQARLEKLITEKKTVFVDFTAPS